MVTVSKATVHKLLALCEVTADPASSVPVRFVSTFAVLGIAAQVAPSLELYTVNVVPVRTFFFGRLVHHDPTFGPRISVRPNFTHHGTLLYEKQTQEMYAKILDHVSKCLSE